MVAQTLTEKVLPYDTRINRELKDLADKKELANLVLGHVLAYLSEDGSRPMQHEVVYGLRIAGELAREDPQVRELITELGNTYNQSVDRGSQIHRVNFYRDGPVGDKSIVDTLRFEVN